MGDVRIQAAFRRARANITAATSSLEGLRATYALSTLPDDVKASRMAALDAKIDYLRGLSMNADAHPWVGDTFGGAS